MDHRQRTCYLASVAQGTDLPKGSTYSDREKWFAENLRRTREERGLTQAALAERMSQQGFPFHAMTISRIEKGERPVRLSEAVALAGILERNLSVLIMPTAAASAEFSLNRLTDRIYNAYEKIEKLGTEILEAQREMPRAVAMARQAGVSDESIEYWTRPWAGVDPHRALTTAQKSFEQREVAEAAWSRAAGEWAAKHGDPEDGLYDDAPDVPRLPPDTPGLAELQALVVRLMENEDDEDATRMMMGLYQELRRRVQEAGGGVERIEEGSDVLVESRGLGVTLAVNGTGADMTYTVQLYKGGQPIEVPHNEVTRTVDSRRAAEEVRDGVDQASS